jgi:transcriptional regulator with XRE-family HTH domain
LSTLAIVLFTNLLALGIILPQTTSNPEGGKMATVGERIREVRDARNWTQEKLSDSSGISKSFLSEVENKGKNISLDLLLRIAQALGTTVQYLATGEGEEPTARRPIVIPVELSQAAEELHLSHQETIDLLGAYNSVVARRSKQSKGVASVEDWKELHNALKNVLKKTYG